MANKNIRYSSDEILKFYSASRQSWDELYPSERRVFEIVGGKKASLGDLFDVGCACGGLGKALSERFKLNSYTGIDIHKPSIDWAKSHCGLKWPATFIAGDIIEHAPKASYDTVVSLGCADWNVETAKIITACWKGVKPGGHLIISLRLTPGTGINDIAKSYQMINFSGRDEKPETANYVVLNYKEATETLKALSPRPELIGAYGYWGKPSSMAVTPFEKIVFSVFYLRRGLSESKDTLMDIDLPKDAVQ